MLLLQRMQKRLSADARKPDIQDVRRRGPVRRAVDADIRDLFRDARLKRVADLTDARGLGFVP